MASSTRPNALQALLVERSTPKLTDWFRAFCLIAALLDFRHFSALARAEYARILHPQPLVPSMNSACNKATLEHLGRLIEEGTLQQVNDLDSAQLPPVYNGQLIRCTPETRHDFEKLARGYFAELAALRRPLRPLYVAAHEAERILKIRHRDNGRSEHLTSLLLEPSFHLALLEHNAAVASTWRRLPMPASAADYDTAYEGNAAITLKSTGAPEGVEWTIVSPFIPGYPDLKKVETFLRDLHHRLAEQGKNYLFVSPYGFHRGKSKLTGYQLLTLSEFLSEDPAAK